MIDSLTFKILIKKTAFQDSIERNLFISNKEKNISHIFPDFNPGVVLNLLRRESSETLNPYFEEPKHLQLIKKAFRVWTSEKSAKQTFYKNKEFIKNKALEINLSYKDTVSLYFAIAMYHSNLESTELELICWNNTLYTAMELCKQLSVVVSDLPSNSSNVLTTGDLFFTFTKHLAEYHMDLDDNMNAFKFSSHSDNLECIFKNLFLLETLRYNAYLAGDTSLYSRYDLILKKDVILLHQYGRCDDLKNFLRKLSKYEVESLGYLNFKKSNINTQLFDPLTTQILKNLDSFNLRQLTCFITYQYFNYSKGYITKHAWLQFFQPAKKILSHYITTDLVKDSFHIIADKVKSSINLDFSEFAEEVLTYDIYTYPSFIKYYIEDPYPISDDDIIEHLRKYLEENNLNTNPYIASY